MKISTTITKKFFEMKIEDLKYSGYFLEYKERKTFWNKRLDFWFDPHAEVEIVFLAGSKPYRFKVIDIWVVHFDFIPKKYQSAITTEYAYVIKCAALDTLEPVKREVEAAPTNSTTPD